MAFIRFILIWALTVILGGVLHDSAEALITADLSDPAYVAERMLAPEGLYPFVVTIVVAENTSIRKPKDAKEAASGAMMCNGTLVSPRWVVTSAHCVKNVEDSSKVQVRSGSVRLDTSESNKVKRVIVHPDYNPTNQKNDAALLELTAPVTSLPIGIASENDYKSALFQVSNTPNAIIAGWGQLFEGDKGSLLHQKQLSVRASSPETCKTTSTYGDRITPSMLCAESIFKGVDACFGFSGAPLFAVAKKDNPGKFFVLGIVSWGEGCAREKKPTVYTNLFALREWIYAKIDAPSQEREENLKPPVIKVVDPFAKSIADSQAGVVSRISATEVNYVADGLFRYMASISQKGTSPGLTHFCGGVLVTRQWLLTAAHCVESVVSAASIQVKIDSVTLDGEGIYLDAQKIIPHPNYSRTQSGSLHNDVALIKVAGPVPSDVAPISLLSGASLRDIQQSYPDATVVGWGKNAYSRFARLTNFLRWARVEWVGMDRCNSRDAYAGLVDQQMLCAGIKGNDACQGDSGGPLLVFDRTVRAYQLVGIVSWGAGCGELNKPGVYARIPSYLAWIERTIRGN